MKKDLNWFKEQLDDIEMNTPRLGSHDSIWMLDKVYELINQLDEPEVLSQEWIDEHLDYADVRGGAQAFINVEDLQNLLVPKQEETNDDLYILKVRGGYVTDFELVGGRVSAFSRGSEYGADVVMASKPFMEFVQRQVGGELYNITNSDEQKYNVKLKVKSSFGTVGIFLYKEGDEVLAGDNFRVYYPKEEEYMLTEQEIRGFQNGDVLFEHFAKPVEELL